jgi:hypothetical protein
MGESSGTDGHQGDWRLIDPERSVCLRDVGAPDFIAALTVGPDGTETFWIADRDLIGQNCDHGNPNPRHEKLGRLPQTVRDRIWGDSLRCRRFTAAGKPCGQRVAEPGTACGIHQGMPLPETPPPPPQRRPWPRAVCPHCGNDCAIAPKRGTFSPHQCKCVDCRLVEKHPGDPGYEVWDYGTCPMSGQPAGLDP